MDFGFYNLDCMKGMKEIDSKSVQLIIADPPYFEVKGKFDFIWDSFDDYLKDVERWAVECKRILADNGTLFWYGHAKKIAYSQIILDKYFNLESCIVWENTNDHKQQLRFSEGLRSFAPCTERILMYSKEWDFNSLDAVMFNPENFKSIKEYLKQQKKEVMKHFNFSAKEFNDYTLKLGCSTTPYKNWFCNTSFWEMATEVMYKKLQGSEFFKKPFSELRKEYEVLRKEYEVLRRPFDNYFNLGDVIKLPNYETKKHNHDTVKPEKLTEVLMLTCSREGDLIVVPFGGSGTECVTAERLNREYIGFEIDAGYFRDATKRIKQARNTTIDMFKEPKPKAIQESLEL